MRVVCFLFLFVWSAAVSAATVELVTLDASDQPLPCRILVRGADGQCAVPPGAVTLQTGPDRWFMSSGRSQVDVPDGVASVRVEHGTEYIRIKEQLEIEGDLSKTYKLRRWIDMQQQGYLCSENHLHVDSVQLAPMLVCEGLDFGSSLTWWRGPDQRRPIPTGQGPHRLLEFAGRTVPTSIFDAELEYAWGAAYIQNLPTPLPLKAEPGRPNLDYLRHAVGQGAIVHYQGGWSREVLVDALLGCVHTVNVCNNNFALHRFQPRSRYSNLLQVENFPVYPDTDVGMLQLNNDTYYRLLNCGLQLAAGGGSATGVKQAPVGYNRAYVRGEPGISLAAFYAAWKAGKNFVTNGPMLLLRTKSGKAPGDTVQLPGEGGQVKLRLEALSDQPLSRVEILVNGKVAVSCSVDDSTHVVHECALQINSGSWIAARCVARDELLSDVELGSYRDRNGNSSFRVAPSRLRFAHTSPVYVTVAGRHCAEIPSLAEGFQMLEQFETFARKTADHQYQPSILKAISVARERLLELASGRPRSAVRTYHVSRTESKIQIDGRLDEQAWDDADVVGQFEFPWWKRGSKEATRAKLLWDDDHLYVAFRCDDAHIWAEQRERDGRVYDDDCVELFAAPNPNRPFDYFNLEMNVRGAFLDQHHPHGPGRAPNWNAKGITLATVVNGTLNDDSDTDHGWVLEAAIPFSNFRAVARHTPPRAGDAWHLNLNRLGGNTNPQFSQWSPSTTRRPNFHTPQYFGRVVFSNRASSE